MMCFDPKVTLLPSVINLDTVAEVTIFNLSGLALAIFSSWCITAYVTTAPGK